MTQPETKITNHETTIPEGWRFHSSRFRRQNQRHTVTLRRDDDGMAWFHSLSITGQELAEYEVHGTGTNLNEAIADAVAKISGLVLDRGKA